MLQGTLDTLSFAEVLSLAARKDVTGFLQVKTAKGRTVIHLHGGRIVGVDGEDATSGGFHRRAEDVVAHLMTAERGTFQLRPAGHVGDADGAIEIEDALVGARRLLDEWREVEAAIPSLDARPRLVSSLDSQGVTLSRDQWRLLQAIDGHRSVRTLARLLGVSHPEVARGLRALLDVGAIQFESPSAVAVPLPGQPVRGGFDPTDTRATIVIRRSRASSSSSASGNGAFGPAAVPLVSGESVERRRSRPGWGWLRRRRPVPDGPAPDDAADGGGAVLPQAG